VHFYGERVVRVKIESEKNRKEVEELGLDVWSHDGNVIIGDVDIRLSEKDEQTLLQLGIPYRMLIEDLESVCNQERENLKNRSNKVGASWYDVYHPYAEIVQHIQELAIQYPLLVKYIPSIGESVEGRALPALTVTTANPPFKIFFGGGQHAREWIGPATVLFLIEKLITGYGTDPDATKILDLFQFLVVPVINVDGYVFTWEANRLWRKNRKLNSNGSFGVDLNRNWDDHWCQIGASTNPSSDTYCGTGPFSEPEIKFVSSFVLSNLPFEGAIDYHSYSQLILRPYGWTQTPPPNDAIPKAAGDAYATAIRNTSGLIYVSQPAWQLYDTSGTSRDWFGSGANIPRGYTIELRDTGNFGFQLPPEQIIPTGEENWAGIKAFVNQILISKSMGL